ncbi:hypothetical protein PSTG_10676 [Puccinia striiformis f. sp. tritici PST-78]|uniref:OTU domain-containing protein n=1 Tax=Puccinia striiformis f. sp. tritici PST-78 TaxID=1165861 RepID=A0A0L0V9N0_9BASI|nr:hypothetical protein PSTG_10676 [Puccinia striiformis f. sp. tritici PST-78]
MSHPTNTNINTKNPINPPDDTKGTINNSGVTVSPAVWKQLQNLLAMHPGPSPSTTSNLDQSYPSENPFDSSNPIEDEDTNDNSNSGSNSKEFLPDDILESLNVTGYRDGHQKKAACFVDQDLKSLETTDSASDLPTLITDPQSYDFTTGEPMEPPPVTRFLTKDDLLRFCQLWAKTHGYAVCNSHSAAEKNVYIRCDRGGIYEGKKTNQSGRKTASSKTDCPFKLKGSIPTSKNITNKTWTLEVQEGTHNHDPSPGASSHAAHRKLQPDQVLELRKAAKKSVDGKLEKDKPVDPWKQFMGLWNWVTYAKSPELYTKRFQNLKVFLSTRPAVLAYLKKNIIPVKKLFVVAWACQYPHLRNLNTSRVESGHAHLKTFVTSSTGDLLSVFQALGHTVDAQILAVHESIGKDTIKTLVHVPKCFIPLLGEISSFTIKEAMDQFDQLKNNFNPMEPCSQTLTTGVGIPCAHQIAEILESGSTLTPDDFHSQWSLKYNPETHTVVALQAPAVKEKNTKGRPNSKKQAAKSTKRLPLAFEVAEADFKKAESSKKRAAKSSAPHKSKRSKKTKDDEVLSHTDLTDEESDVEGSVDYELKDKSDGNESENEENNESENEENNESENEQNNENTNKQENEEAKKNKNIKEEENKKIQEDSNKNKEDDDNKTLSNGEKVEYLCQIPDHLHPFIRQVFNPIGDSNCGFRCVAKALGYEDDGWFRVQQEMVKEIVGNKELYMKLQGGEQELKRIVEGLQVKSKKTKIDPSKWLNKMAHGQVLANVYTIPVVFLSLVACNTFLPLKTGPHESSNTAPLYLIHVNGNHWVLATVEAINSVKPIPPAVSATKSTSKNAKGWTAFIKKGVNLYKKGENKKKS